MAYRPKLRKTDKVEVAFMNWLAQMSLMILPRFLYLILGRASAKTTDIITERIIDMAEDIPGAPIAWVSDTYSNLQKNVLPSFVEGLKRKGYNEGEHYVIGKAPPEYTEAEKEDLPDWLKDSFWKPYNELVSYKHTMIFYTGLNITFGSLDQPASLAGRSYVHVIGDEAKYFQQNKIANLLKALRGYFLKFGHSVYYRGQTFTTDMPNPHHVGEYDWILKHVDKMKKDGIMRILKTAFVLNEAVQERLHYEQRGDYEEVAKKTRTEERWRERWIKSRMHKDGHTFFFVASSLVNIDILTNDWFSDAIEDDMGDVDTAILSLESTVASGERFYSDIGESHFYKDGLISDWHDRYGINIIPDCRELRYLNRKRAFDVGLDFGNMMSATIGQIKPGNEYRILKFMHVLSPKHIRHLALNIIEYFNPQEEKTINCYYDRAGNNHRDAGVDLASAFKIAIEFKEDGKTRTGWRVNLMSLNQGNIKQSEEHIFMKEMMGGYNKRLPKLLIDMYQCKCLKSSLELARTKIRISKSGSKIMTKDKSSERMELERLPMYSTNASDSFKYLLMRREWRSLVKQRAPQHLMDTTVG